MDKQDGFKVLTIGLVVLGIFLVIDSTLASAYGGGGNTTGVSSTSTTGTNSYTLSVTAQDQLGNPLKPTVTVDSVQLSNTAPVSVQLTVGQHIVSCGALAGYNSLSVLSRITVPTGSWSAGATCFYSAIISVSATISAVDQNNNPLSVPVFIAGQQVGSTPLTNTYPQGTNVGCGIPNGYNPVVTSYNIQSGGSYVCKFTNGNPIVQSTSTGTTTICNNGYGCTTITTTTASTVTSGGCSPTCTLQIQAQICQSSCSPYNGGQNQYIQVCTYSQYVSSAQCPISGNTDGNGNLLVQVPANSGVLYILWNSNNGQAQVTVGNTSPISVIVYGSPSGQLSAFKLSILGTVLQQPVNPIAELIVGAIFLVLAIPAFVKSRD